MRRDFLQPASWTLKIVAAVFWLHVASVVFYVDVPNLRANAPPQYRDAPADWGTPAYYQRVWWRVAKTALMVALVLIPNRVLVSSKVVFAFALLASLIPWHVILQKWFGGAGLSNWLFLGVVTLGALPASITLSYLRFQRGERVTYA